MRKFFTQPLHIQILSGMAAGLAFGLVAVWLGWAGFTTDYIKPFGTIFINLLKLIAIPMIVTSLITGITSLSDMSKLGRMGGRTIGIFMTTTVLAISIGLLVVNVMQPGKLLPAETRAQLMAGYAEKAAEKQVAAEKVQSNGPLKPLIDLFPENLVAAAGDNQNMLQLVLMAIAFGLAIVMLPGEKTAPVVNFMQSANEVVLKLVDIVMLFAPIGVFALIASLFTDLAGNNPAKLLNLMGALGYYSLAVIIGLILHLSIIYMGLAKVFAKVSPMWLLRKMRPVHLLAFSTSSSNATLPLNIENATERMGIGKETAGFVLPMGATINMDGTSLYQAVAAVFIAQAFNLELSISQQLTIVLTALMASIGSAGVPGAGMVMLAIVLNAVGIPVEGIALVMGVDRLIDMCRTVINVTGDCVVACVIARQEGSLSRVE